MKKGYNLDQRKGQISDIQNNVEIKKKELDDLKNRKEDMLDAMTMVQGAISDEKVQSVVLDSINQSLSNIEQQGEQLSDEMNDDVKMIEEIRESTEEDIDSTNEQQNSLEKKKQLLDKFGIGGALDQGIAELSDHKNGLEQLKNDAIETMRDLENVTQQLRML